MRVRQPWSIEQKEWEAKGYKYDDTGTCVFDPTAPIIPETVPMVVKHVIVEPRPPQMPKKVIVDDYIRIKLPKKPKKRGK